MPALLKKQGLHLRALLPALFLAPALTVSSGAGALAQERPPYAARIDCPMPNGDPDYMASYAFDTPDITVSRGDDSAAYRVTGRIHYDKSVIISTIGPDGLVTAMFVMGDQNRIAYYRDGALIEERDCRLLEAKYPY